MTDDITDDGVNLSYVFEKSPPNIGYKISDIAEFKFVNSYGGSQKKHCIDTVDIHLHCDNTACMGPRCFRTTSKQIILQKDDTVHIHVRYTCSNCQESIKYFSLAIDLLDNKSDIQIKKLGENPSFAPLTPANLFSLIGTDRDNFLNGRKCEIQGLGIGAFVYYRRVVENQRERILCKIKKVMKQSNIATDKIDIAINEIQFKKSIELTKDVLPESLHINGQNPLLLLHRALSIGVHEMSDEECLKNATSVRVVLIELVERLQQILKDNNELKQAMSHLIQLPVTQA
ncbi:hypothetical protein JD969_19435 [Planctomycetota bacterium]|nr:hypothetical protein JD969_19435 [Planctomycetota bacterium]